MNIKQFVTDNISEILVKIIEFTRTRQEILSKNVIDCHNPDFTPEDLDVDEFSDMLNEAIVEHVQKHRLIMRDTKSFKFGAGGKFEIRPLPDKNAKKLLETNHDQYVELQINKLMENSLNQRIATELLKQKQSIASLHE